jgi:hypothetical protein
MSRIKRKYKRTESFSFRVRPIAPDSPPRAAVERTVEGKAVSSASSAAESPAGGRRRFFSGIERRWRMGFRFAQGKATSADEEPPPESALRVPPTVSGKPIGSIQAAGKEAGWTAQEIKTVSAGPSNWHNTLKLRASWRKTKSAPNRNQQIVNRDRVFMILTSATGFPTCDPGREYAGTSLRVYQIPPARWKGTGPFLAAQASLLNG